MNACGPEQNRTQEVSRTYSLTNGNFSGKKTYFGWGAAGQGDPSMMHNEVKYDVLHTHDIFTTGAGGSYKGTKYVGTVASSQIRQQWQSIANESTSNDMYVQYSSGHGYPQGLGVGVSYADMASAALSLRSREIIVFTMACYSGGLVDAFNRRQSEWQNFEASDRTLLVMSSSTGQQTSSTGPGTDSQQSGPTGSAGSAYGHSLWKALRGDADGYLDGVRDGYISLGEVVTFATDYTKKIGGHSPLFTGVFDPLLIMNKVPSGNYLSSVGNASDDASTYEMADAAESLDRSQASEASLLLQKNPLLKTYTYDGQIYVSVAAAADASVILASGPSSAATLIFCEGINDTQCTAQSGKSLQYVQAAGQQKIFKTPAALALQAGKRFGFVALDGAGQVVARRTVAVVVQSQQPVTPPPQPVTPPAQDGVLAVQDMRLAVPAGWKVRQDAVDEGRIVLVLRNGTRALSLYVGRLSVDLRTTFASTGSQVTKAERAESIGGRSWQRLDAGKNLNTGAKGFSGQKNVAAFKTDLNGTTYYGYGTGTTAAEAEAAVTEILGALR